MRCPFCDADKESLKVIDSRACEGGRAIRRRRECIKCSKRFTTYERVEQQMKLTVVKKDGRRMPWNRASILNGLERACFKLAVPDSELHRIVDEVEEEVFATFDREVPSSAIGQLVIDHLRRLDKVAYVRFASVYREFRTVQEVMDEARAVLDAHRFDDPGQGRLFIDDAAARARENGHGKAHDEPKEPSTRRKRGKTPANGTPADERSIKPRSDSVR
jgi:transcriptional repressor NrdR